MWAERLEVDESLLVGSQETDRGWIVCGAHQVTLYARKVKWCGKLYSGTGVRHDPERIRGLVEMRRRETVSELMQFLKAADWMPLYLPSVAEVVSLLRELLERKLKGTTRTKRVASRKVISEEDRSKEIQVACQSSCELLVNVVQLNFRKWEPVEVMFKDVPIFLVRKLKQIRLRKRVNNALRQRYGIKSERRMNI